MYTYIICILAYNFIHPHRENRNSWTSRDFDFPRSKWSLMGIVEFEHRRSIDKKETREWKEKKRHREQREAERVQGLRLRS